MAAPAISGRWLPACFTGLVTAREGGEVQWHRFGTRAWLSATCSAESARSPTPSSSVFPVVAPPSAARLPAATSMGDDTPKDSSCDATSAAASRPIATTE